MEEITKRAGLPGCGRIAVPLLFPGAVMSKVIVVGSANTDLTVKAERLPRSGETVRGDEFMVFYGGKGANQALAALKAGASVTFLAKIGTDVYGNCVYDRMVRSGLAPVKNAKKIYILSCRVGAKVNDTGGTMGIRAVKDLLKYWRQTGYVRNSLLDISNQFGVINKP